MIFCGVNSAVGVGSIWLDLSSCRTCSAACEARWISNGGDNHGQGKMKPRAKAAGPRVVCPRANIYTLAQLQWPKR